MKNENDLIRQDVAEGPAEESFVAAESTPLSLENIK
jgi:hypothetical protein